MPDETQPASAGRRPLQLGLNLPYTEGQMDGATPRWSDILAMARRAEAVGFDSIWVSDHLGFADEGAPDGWNGAWESLVLLSALAASTERVLLGTYVTCVPFRNPGLLAKMAETLDEVSGGRFILGLGAGWNEPEFDAFGFPFERRFDRFEESLRIITALLRTGRADLDGSYVRATGARLRPRGPRPEGLEVMVGATGQRLLRLTAELADHWNGGARTPEEAELLLAEVDGACRAAGRDPSTLKRSVEAIVRVLPANHARPDQADGETDAGEDPTVIAEVIRRYANLGIDHLQVQLRPNSVEAVEAFRPVIEMLDAGESAGA
jgi:probable F420-dependent oxidoreductase